MNEDNLSKVHGHLPKVLLLIYCKWNHI